MPVTKIPHLIVQAQGSTSQFRHLTSQQLQHTLKNSAIELIIWSVSYPINGHLYRILVKLK